MIGNREIEYMKKIFYAAAALAASFVIASCEVEPVVNETNIQSDVMLISASIEKALTKTALSGSDQKGYEVVWSEGDQINLQNTSTGKNVTFTLKNGAGTTDGVFDGPQLEDGEYDVFYATTTASIPTNQNYDADRISNAPMSATLTVAGGKADPISFRNMGGILRLTVKNIQKASLKSICFAANLSVSSTRIFLDCGTAGVELSEDGTVFHIAMPEGSYNSVSIEVSDGNKTVTKTLNKEKTIDIFRSQITDASFTVLFDGKSYPTYHKGHEYVNLGLPSGLMWAACNLGADEPWKTGNLYNWNDATIDWGGDWRLPTLEEMNELLNEASWIISNHPDKRDVHGYVARGNGHFVFFPDMTYTGDDYTLGGVGYYWSSTVENVTPYAMMLFDPSPGVKNECRRIYPHYLFSVRPVLEIK